MILLIDAFDNLFENFITFDNFKYLVHNIFVERVNQENHVDVAALNHDIAYKQQQFDEINTKLKNLIQTIEDNPDLTSALKPTIHQYFQVFGP